MIAYVFPGQGAQFVGMGKELFDTNPRARAVFEQADAVLGFPLTETMFSGAEAELKQTNITQPAIFVHSIAVLGVQGAEATFDAVAGHSLGEFSALVAAGVLDFADGLKLVHQRATAMQRACELEPGTMAAVLGLEDKQIEEVCAQTEGVVVPANYNSPGQLVISGSEAAIVAASEKLKEAGARRVVPLPVGGAFHSPLMQPAQDELRAAIEQTDFRVPKCPIYQNVDAQPATDPEVIMDKLIRQLTSPVRWTQTVQQMRTDGISEFVEVGGKGNILQGLIRKIDRGAQVRGLEG